MDTSDSEAFESADENFDNDNTCKENQSIPATNINKSDSDVGTTETRSSNVHNKIDDISNLLDNLQVKFDHVEQDCGEKLPVWEDDDLINLNTDNSQITNENIPSEVVSKSTVVKIVADVKSQCENIASNQDILVENRKPVEDVASSGWYDDDLVNLNIQEETTKSTKFDVCCENVDDDVDTSGWDNDVDWIPIEDDDKVEKVSTGWDDFDTWDTIEDVKSTPQPPQATSTTSAGAGGGGVWSTWGVTSLLTSATEGVTTFTSQMSQGLTTVLESSIGVPSPEELAKAQKLEREQLDETSSDNQLPQPNEISGGGVFGLGNLLTGVTKLVETTSSKVVTTGLDTLETIGKKTMEVLQEGDPGLIKKRALLGLNPDKPCLSQVLREAKEKAADNGDNIKNDNDENRSSSKKKVHFETLFDDYQGLVHLEALEMLSKQCDIKLCTIIESLSASSNELNELQETMLQIKELCELPDDDDDDNNHYSENQQQQQVHDLQMKLMHVVNELGITTRTSSASSAITFVKLFDYWNGAEHSMKTVQDINEIYRMGIDTLAKVTSMAMEQFHKCAELLLIQERRSTADEADSLVQITTLLTAFIGIIAAKYSEKLDSLSTTTDNPTELNALITNIFFEATQSSSYVQDAFQLFIPILQIGAV